MILEFKESQNNKASSLNEMEAAINELKISNLELKEQGSHFKYKYEEMIIL